MGYIRFLLAACVLLGHTGAFFGWVLPGGNIAVEAFFIISGFYISLILNQKYIHDKGSYKLFIGNRLLRLLPLYYLLIAARLFFDVFLSIENPTNIFALYNYVHLNLGSLLFFMLINITVVGQDIVHFLGINNGQIFLTNDFLHSPSGVNAYSLLLAPQMWTISLEIVFYLIAPFILRKQLKFLIGIIIASFLLRIIFYSFGLNFDPWTYRFLPLELVFFFSGAAIYHLYVKVSQYKINVSILKLIYGLNILAIIFYTWIPTKIIYNFDLKQWGFYILTLVSLPFIFTLTKDLLLDRLIGNLSYPIYIIHLFVNDVAININPNLPHTLPYGAIILFVTVIISIILNETFGRWIEDVRYKNFKQVKVS